MASQPTEPAAETEGLISLASRYRVDETLDRLESVLKSKGVTVFARIDHRAAAERVGLTMRPAQVLVFGSPRTGTPVMNASPTIAIDLPIKALTWEDAAGQVWLSYNSVDYLASRHKVPTNIIKPLEALGSLIAEALK